MFVEIINILLEKKANLAADKEAELNAFAAELDAKYAEREEKINRLLDDAGYVECVDVDEVEVVGEIEEVGEAVEETVEEVVEETQPATEEEDWR